MTVGEARFKQFDKSAEQVDAKNRLHDDIQWEFLRLRETVEGRGVFLALVDDPSPRVRFAAATRVLAPDQHKACVVVCIELAMRSDMVRLKAGIVVKGFDSGGLNVAWRPRSCRGKPAHRMPAPTNWIPRSLCTG